jgi:type IV secretory pathway TrbD component
MAEHGERLGRRVILGYHVEIRKGLWERVKTLGAPRIPASLWLAGCLSTAFVCAMLVGVKWGIAVMGLWLFGHGTMVVLTQMDPHWDDVMLAQWVRRYKAAYDAG